MKKEKEKREGAPFEEIMTENYPKYGQTQKQIKEAQMTPNKINDKKKKKFCQTYHFQITENKNEEKNPDKSRAGKIILL